MNFLVASTASASLTTSTGIRRLSALPVHGIVGLTTKGNSSSAYAAASSVTLLTRTDLGPAMPSSRAAASVRSLSVAMASASSDATARTQPSSASRARCGASATITPSPVGSTTRTWWARTKSASASANAAASAP